MAILLTGGTGKTSPRIARFLQEAKIPFILAARKGASPFPDMLATKFDWLDPSTFDAPFEHAFPGGEKITGVYLVAPGVADPVPSMNAFIDHAAEKHGVRRFVLVAGSSAEPGGYYVGKVWQHLLDRKVEYCVLRPTWFMENFNEAQFFPSIKNEGRIYTSCGDGKIPFVSAFDIAAVAFRALVDEKPHNTDHRVLGPELLTYDQIAEKMTRALGREVVHVKQSPEENIARHMKLGFSEYYAKLLVGLEVGTANGDETRENDAVERVTGRPPMTFDAWVQENKAAWD